MLPQDGVDLGDRELVEADDLGARTEGGRHDSPRLVLVVSVDDDPRPVVSVPASPVRVRDPVRPALLKDVDDPRARDPFGVVRYFDEKACHGFCSLRDAGWRGPRWPGRIIVGGVITSDTAARVSDGTRRYTR